MSSTEAHWCRYAYLLQRTLFYMPKPHTFAHHFLWFTIMRSQVFKCSGGYFSTVPWFCIIVGVTGNKYGWSRQVSLLRISHDRIYVRVTLIFRFMEAHARSTPLHICQLMEQNLRLNGCVPLCYSLCSPLSISKTTLLLFEAMAICGFSIFICTYVCQHV